MADLREKVRALTVRTGGSVAFTKEVWRATSKPGIELADNQFFRPFSVGLTDEPSLWAHVKPLLAPGETAHLNDGTTGLDLPAVVPAGHTYFSLQWHWNVSQLARFQILLGIVGVTPRTIHTDMTLETLHRSYGFSDYTYSTTSPDPLGQFNWDFDMTITNRGDKPLRGYIDILGMETIIGSPWSDKRKVRCKHCGAMKEVPNEAIYVECDECGKVTLYRPILRGGRRIPIRG